MIQTTPHMRFLVAEQPVDFRKGIDGLCQLCRRVLAADPFTGTVFIFCNRKRTSLKLLMYDGQGFWLCQKRLSQGRFQWWPAYGEPFRQLAVHELQVLIWNGNPDFVRISPAWKKIS